MNVVLALVYITILPTRKILLKARVIALQAE